MSGSVSSQRPNGLLRTPHRWIWIDRIPSPADEAVVFEAFFRFELEGIVRPRRSEDCRPEEKMRNDMGWVTYESVLEALYPGQRIEFHFSTWRSGDNRPGMDWNIVGRTRASTMEEARSNAERLWENLAILLDSQPNYRFQPRVEPMPQYELDWTYRLSPRTAEVAAHEMGFHGPASTSDTPTLLLPMLDPQPAKPLPLVAIMTGLPVDLDLCLGLEPTPLGDAVRGRLVAMDKTLRDSIARCQVWPQGRPLEKEVVLNQTPQWLQMIEYWLAHVEAISVEVTLRSSAPVSQGLMGLLGTAIFPHYSFEPEGNSEGADPAREQQRGRSEFDLRALLHDDRALLLTLFPDAAQLGELNLPRSYPLPPSRLPRKGLLLGSVNAQDILLSPEDRLRHSYIVGATGSGKSTLLLNLITQDIRAGRGVCLIDPHGDLYEEVLDRVPKERAGEVVIFNPSDFEWAPGLNFLECTTRYPEVEQSLITNEMMLIFDRLYDLRQTGGPMFEQYMRNALMLVMGSPESGGTLMDVPLLFESIAYRRSLLKTCTHPLVVGFWKDQAEKAGGEGALANMVPYITSKLNQFTHNVLMRRIIGQKKTTIHFRQIMDQGGILLINLAKGLLSQMDARMLGMLLMGKLFHAALGRIDLPLSQRRTFHVYVDEFQNFTTATVGHMLSEARKFGLCMTLANQHLAQLEKSQSGENVLDAVLGNVGNILLFRLGVLDAEQLEKFTKPWLDGKDLQYLPDYHVAARLLSEHSPVKPFVFRTDAKPPAAGERLKQRIIQHSRQRDARPTREVDASIMEAIRSAQGLDVTSSGTADEKTHV